MSINGRQDFKLRVNALFLDSCYMYGDGTKFYNLECLNLNALWDVTVCENSVCNGDNRCDRLRGLSYLRGTHSTWKTGFLDYYLKLDSTYQLRRNFYCSITNLWFIPDIKDRDVSNPSLLISFEH